MPLDGQARPAQTATGCGQRSTRRRRAAVCLACALISCDPAQTTDETEEGSAPPSGTCDATPGNYLVTYDAVSDDCGGTDDLPIERYTIATDGEITTAAGRRPGEGSAPNGCFDDDAEVDACLISFTRECSIETDLGPAVVRGDYSLDFDSRTGSVAVDIGLFVGSTLLQSCQARQAARITTR